MKFKINLKQFRLSMVGRTIVAGFILIIPLATTLIVVSWLFQKADSIIPKTFHRVFPFFPEQWITGLGLIFLLVICYFVGIAAKNYFGRIIIDTGNAIISSIPLINKIYLGIQQVVDSVTKSKKALFDKAVLIEYPKENSYCIGFVTAETTGEIPEKTDSEMLSIFVPTTPNPTSGFLLFLPKSEVIELDMNIETAVKTVMSAGMVNTDQIKDTNHIYKLPKQLKNFNWMGIFGKHKHKSPFHDPRD